MTKSGGDREDENQEQFYRIGGGLSYPNAFTQYKFQLNALLQILKHEEKRVQITSRSTYSYLQQHRRELDAPAISRMISLTWWRGLTSRRFSYEQSLGDASRVQRMGSAQKFV